MMRASLILLLLAQTILLSAQSDRSSMSDERILFVVSNSDSYGESEIDAANHFAEIVLPYDEFTKAGYSVDFVSPEGGAIPIGYIDTSSTTQKTYINDSDFMERLKHTKRPSEVEPSIYSAIFYVGGGAAMFGIHDNEEIQALAMHIYEQERGIVSAICHGTAGIVDLKTKDGDYLVAGKSVNGFPDIFEDKEADYYQTFPFSIEGRIKDNGGDFQYSAEGWDGFTQVDGRLITGQDPTSGRRLAKLIIAALAESN